MPSRSCASTLSPSVTATSRMLSPNRATLSERASWHPAAARAQVPICRRTRESCQCPTTVLRTIPIRVSTNANSRSPCADWFRFMKSMSISDHGRSRLNCVWRWRSGCCSALSPGIHIFAGEKVCIHAITPTHDSAAFASSATRRIASGLVATSRHTTRTGTSSCASRPAATCRACCSTCSSVAFPYISWLPATSQASRCPSAFIDRPAAPLDQAPAPEASSSSLR